jgi:hypothetical protein
MMLLLSFQIQFGPAVAVIAMMNYYHPSSYAQENNNQQQQPLPTANITNTKYLTIKEQEFVPTPPGSYSSSPGTITGTVVNNSTFTISFPSVYAILYDQNNTVITVKDHFVDVNSLGPGQESLFSIDLFSFGPIGVP